MGKTDDQVNRGSRANKESRDHPERPGSGEFLDLKATEESPDFQGKREKRGSRAELAVMENLAKRVQRGRPDSREWWGLAESRANQVNRDRRESQASPEHPG